MRESVNYGLDVGERRVSQHHVVVRVGDDWHLEVVEEALDEAGNHIGILDLFQALVVAGSQKSQDLVLLIDCHALPKDAFQLQCLRLALEVADEVLQDQRDSQFAQLEILN